VSAKNAVLGTEQALERLGRLPGGPELLAQARRREDISLVGGAVRDLLLGHWPRELDVTVAGDSAALADALAASISPSERPYGHTVEPTLHERFGTASVKWDYGQIDVAELRSETYGRPGALPEVRAGSVEQDLARRDFTVNAIALPLGGARRGQLSAVEGAFDDLAEGRLRVLHEQSFSDDPTRLMRLARYAARLGFEIEPETRLLAERAIGEGAMSTISGGRAGAELWLAACDADACASLRELDALGVLGALGIAVPFEDELAARAEALLMHDGDHGVLLMAALLRTSDVAELAGGLELPGESGRRVIAVASAADALAERIAAAESPGRVQWLLDGNMPETAALAGALAAVSSPDVEEAVRGWLTGARHDGLEIDGEDIIAAGVEQGPEIGARLSHARLRKREGRAEGREQELRAALESGAGEENG
jgi:tRNA nucleotidyltransferase (CCA-adding enzyme)